MQIEEGGFYRTRRGDIVGPMIRNLSRLYDEGWNWTYKGRSAGELWRDDGTFGQREEFDLVERVTDPSAGN